MVTGREVRRRRSLHAVDDGSFLEGVVTRSNLDDGMTIEVTGGPCGAIASVRIGNATCGQMVFDGSGTGTVDIVLPDIAGPVQVVIDDRVVLGGWVPVIPETAPRLRRSRPDPSDWSYYQGPLSDRTRRTS
jgi:hypothetical protein